jgi:hypothetical protein
MEGGKIWKTKWSWTKIFHVKRLSNKEERNQDYERGPS